MSQLALETIRVDGGTQPRAATDFGIVEEYANALGDGATLDERIAARQVAREVRRWVLAEAHCDPDVRGLVYFLRSENTGLIKIGWSRNPARRLAQLQTGSAERLQYVLTLVGSRSLETALHRIFADRRVSGEWFDNAGNGVTLAVFAAFDAFLASENGRAAA